MKHISGLTLGMIRSVNYHVFRLKWNGFLNVPWFHIKIFPTIFSEPIRKYLFEYFLNKSRSILDCVCTYYDLKSDFGITYEHGFRKSDPWKEGYIIWKVHLMPSRVW